MRNMALLIDTHIFLIISQIAMIHILSNLFKLSGVVPMEDVQGISLFTHFQHSGMY